MARSAILLQEEENFQIQIFFLKKRGGRPFIQYIFLQFTKLRHNIYNRLVKELFFKDRNWAWIYYTFLILRGYNFKHTYSTFLFQNRWKQSIRSCYCYDKKLEDFFLKKTLTEQFFRMLCWYAHFSNNAIFQVSYIISNLYLKATWKCVATIPLILSVSINDKEKSISHSLPSL